MEHCRSTSLKARVTHNDVRTVRKHDHVYLVHTHYSVAKAQPVGVEGPESRPQNLE